MTPAISTEGRIFVAQLTRDLSAREIAGADALCAGAKNWTDAFKGFGHVLSESAGPVKAGAAFKAAIGRLKTVQKTKMACFVNAHMHRPRSGFMEVMTYEVGKHPITNTGLDGIVVRSYHLHLSRKGSIMIGYGDQVAFMSWHALARLRERGGVDPFIACGFVAACGLAGMIMRKSEKHINTEINYADDSDMIVTGVLRQRPDGHGRLFGFYDVLTVLPLDDDRPAIVAKHKQGQAIGRAVWKYFNSVDADPRGYGKDIPVIPFRNTDYVSRELQEMDREKCNDNCK